MTQARPVNDGAKNAWYGVGGAWGFQESKRRLTTSQRKTHDGGGQSIRGRLPVPVGLAGFCLGVGLRRIESGAGCEGGRTGNPDLRCGLIDYIVIL